MSNDGKQLRSEFDHIATSATSQIIRNKRTTAVQQSVQRAILLLMLAPALLLFVQLIRWLAGYEAGVWFSWPWAVGLTLAIPVISFISKWVSTNERVARKRAIGSTDKAIGSTERLVTADEFLKVEERDGFMNAAIEDAEEWVNRARSAKLDSQYSTEVRLQAAIAAVPIAIILLLCTSWVATFVRESESSVALGKNRRVNTASIQTKPAKQTPPNPGEKNPPKEEPKQTKSKGAQRSINKRGDYSNETPEGVEDSQGKLSDGKTSESQQSSNPSSAKGEPSSQGQPAKVTEKTPKKPKKKPKQKPEKKRKEKPRKKEDEPSGATAGQGSSKGSTNTAAASDWTSKSQQATPDDEDLEDEEDVEDEDEEQDSRGGVQPNMRDRRAPVNRDLQIGFGSNRPNPDANGRGGPGGQKKSRGVASLVLGVPIPDRVTGQPNKGRIRITQQRITPEAEESDQVTAESRPAREGEVGRIHHPTDMAPWLQNFVRRYFLSRRKTMPKEIPTQTTLRAESGIPQS